ncbi:unnamed protein product [Cylindrotheca closterium]|uniref:EGF-like domain-containing protein n=1 Tax=Cylindrotheca closterium TaxID=2856 RepID=A0AAD2FTP2_9STRA|nr:unnamed protein product [Cylindrotheca closterium]
MDAWKVAMKEGERKEASRDGDESDADDSDDQKAGLATLVARMENTEKTLLARMEKTENQVENLQKRLLEAENELRSSKKNAIPWRRIGSGDLTDADIERDDEYQLPHDIYTVISAWKFSSRPFWIALIVIAVQILLLSLLLVDQLGQSDDTSVRIFPANVPIIVHISQGLAIIIAIMGQDDLRIAMEGYFDGIPTRFKGEKTFQGMNQPQWNCSYFTRFLQGLLSVIAAFVLAIQSETVFDVLLNFLGVRFVSELDDLAFLLSELGYLGEECQKASKCISEAKFQQDNRNKVDGHTGSRSWFRKFAHIIGVFAVLATLFAFFLYILINQNQGDFSEQEFMLDMSDDILSFITLFNGCYRVSPTRKRFERRLVYEQVGFEQDGGKFTYCNSIQPDGKPGWTMSIGALENKPCELYVARTEATTTFDLLEVNQRCLIAFATFYYLQTSCEAGEKQWYTSDGTSLENTRLRRVLGSSEECLKSTTFETVTAICENVHFEQSVNQQGTLSVSFFKATISSIQPTVFTTDAISHPVYIKQGSTPELYEIIFFSGNRWVWTNPIAPNVTSDFLSLSMEEYLNTDSGFVGVTNALQSTGELINLVSAGVAASISESTPMGLRWYHNRNEPGLLFDVPVPDLSRPVDIHSFCENCNNVTNPCDNGGICTSARICDCINGGSGELCQDKPLGDGTCNLYFNKEEYGWDGGDCCGESCEGSNCGFAGLSLPFGLDSQSTTVETYDAASFGYEFCRDPSMAPITIQLDQFEVFYDEYWSTILGNRDGKPFCSTSSLNVRCNSKTYMHFPQHVLFNQSDCDQSFEQTIMVPFGSTCELSVNVACFGPFCLDHEVSILYGNSTASEPILTASVKSQAQFAFGVPTKCLTDVLLERSNQRSSLFDLSTPQGIAANSLSNDGLSEFLCANNTGAVLERFALTVFNASVGFKSSNWAAFQCHGWGIPAVKTTCTNNSITSLVLSVDATSKQGTIPSEIAFLSNIDHIALRSNSIVGSLPSTLGNLLTVRTLELWNNTISGSIPTEIFSLSTLEYLALFDNRLVGTIPTEIGALSNLLGFWLENNLATGTMPTEIGALSLLETLHLSNNFLTGKIPDLSNLTRLQACNMSNNAFTGGIAPPACES